MIADRFSIIDVLKQAARWGIKSCLIFKSDPVGQFEQLNLNAHAGHFYLVYIDEMKD
jgi:hypothetical protein